LIGRQKVSQLAVTLVATYIPPLIEARHHVASGTGTLNA
jgi:hypothetical protein